MRYLYYAILAGFLAGSPCFATEYEFTFNMRDDRQLKVKQESHNKWKALEKAGIFCGVFFGIGTEDLTEKETEEIIDTCSNPSFN